MDADAAVNMCFIILSKDINFVAILLYKKDGYRQRSVSDSHPSCIIILLVCQFLQSA